MLQVSVTSSVEMDKEVFVFQRCTLPDNSTDDRFVAIATPVQMEDFDKDSPGEGTSYFRKSELELVGYSSEFIEQVWLDLQSEITSLVEDLNAIEILGPTQTVTIV